MVKSEKIEKSEDGAAIDKERSLAVRAPQQARGKARVEAVLDATAAIIREFGLAGITMHGVAKRAKTPIGSLYHFFSDQSALLSALRDRHREALNGLHKTVRATPAEMWASLTPDAAIDRLVTPFIDYLEANPDCLLLDSGSCKKEEEKTKEGGLDGWRAVVDARMPKVDAAQRSIYAEMLHALAVGAMTMRLRSMGGDIVLVGRYMRELRRALAAYLASVESSIEN